MNRRFLVAITTGDVDGIGLEVTSKALSSLGPKTQFQFVLFRSKLASKKSLGLIDRKFRRITFNDIHSALQAPLSSKNQIYDIASDLPPAIWVETAAKLCLTGTFHALVTGPLSKTSIREAGLKDMGHTGILKRVARADDVYMGFYGSHFSVVLITDHLPLREAPNALSVERIKGAIKAGRTLEPLLRKSLLPKPVALLGLNPHSGEQGLIGDEEINLHTLAINALNGHVPVAGPLVPDAAFATDNWNKYRFFVANYHDQGLIPFKMIHGPLGGVHLTLGLPFLRTSVDHGTAKDIFGRNIASSKSMTEALKAALYLMKKRF